MEKVDVGMKFGRLTVIGEGKREKVFINGNASANVET